MPCSSRGGRGWAGLSWNFIISRFPCIRLYTCTVKPRFTDTRLIRTPHYYKQFALSLGKESPYIYQLIQPAHMDTPLIGKRFMAPSVTGFDCSSDQPLIKTFCSIPSGGVIDRRELVTIKVIPSYFHRNVE